jgi:hypothetical protein
MQSKTNKNKHRTPFNIHIILGISVIFIIFVIILLYIYIGGNAENSDIEKFTVENTDIPIHNNKKIALCFLINKSINHEEKWHDYLKSVDTNKYNIYIHYKENQPLKYFEDRKLQNTIETCWGCLSIVLAQNLLLKEALKDTVNQHFVWLSESCIPIKSFNYVYNNLDINKSYFNISPNSQVFPRADPVLEYISEHHIKKAAMPAILNRKHAQLFADNNDNINLWFKNISNVDEIAYITLLHHFGMENELVLTPNLATDAIIFTGWPDMSNYKTFPGSKLNKHSPNEYNEICEGELTVLITSKSLFARKFAEDCKGLEKLIEKLKNYSI